MRTKELQAIDNKEIVVVNAGWVFIGLTTEEPEKGRLLIQEAYNIRIWGTEHGLGQLALHGPQEKTELDLYGVVAVPLQQILFRIKCQV